MTTTTNDPSAVIVPFLQSRETRQAYLDRSQSLLLSVTTTALSSSAAAASATIVTLPNIDHSTHDERRPTSTYIIRAPSTKELDVLFDPQKCNCRLSPSGNNNTTQIKLMYRAAGNG